MKKLISALLLFALLIAALTACGDNTPADDSSVGEADASGAAEESAPIANPISDFEYSVGNYKVDIDDEGIPCAVITKYVGTSKDVVIPDKIESVVPLLADSLFSGSDIESVVLPDTMMFVSGNVFTECKNLKSVTFGNGIKSIWSNAFRNCDSLEEIVLPDSLEEVEGYAFAECDSLKRVVFPKHDIACGEAVFSDCTSLAEVVIPEGVTTVPGNYSLFLGCPVTEITFPKSVNLLYGGNPYKYTVEKITFLGDAPELKETDFFKDGAVIFYDPETKGWDTTPLRTSYNLYPIGTVIEDYSDDRADRPTEGIFCSTLKWSYDPDSGLLTVSGNGKMEFYIGDDAPWKVWNREIKSVVIEDGVTNLGSRAFEDCYALETVDIPDSVTEFDIGVFENCKSLKEIYIPKSVNNIDNLMFNGCESLTEITVDPENIRFSSEGNCLVDLETKKLYRGCPDSVIPDTVERINNYAFHGCVGLKSIVIPDSVKELGTGTFEGCTSLESVRLPSGITSLDNTFVYCESLKSVDIPDTVEKISSFAFHRCASLKSVHIPASVKYISVEAFIGCPALETVTVDKANETYLGDGNCITVKSSGVLLVGCKNTVIPDYVTEIDYRAFEECSALKSIHIPAGVTKLNPYSFAGCIALETVTVDENNKVYRAEGNCLIERATKSVVLGTEKSIIPDDDTVTSIGVGAFMNCRNFNLYIPENIISIDRSSFLYRNRQLQSFKVQVTVYGVEGSYAEKYCNDHLFAFVNTDEYDFGEAEFPILPKA